MVTAVKSVLSVLGYQQQLLSVQYWTGSIPSFGESRSIWVTDALSRYTLILAHGSKHGVVVKMMRHRICGRTRAELKEMSVHTHTEPNQNYLTISSNQSAGL